MSAPDTIMAMGRSLIQHGPFSDRVYIMHLDPEDMPGIIREADDLARDKGYGKIFVKVPASMYEPFARAGYQTEALVPDMYSCHGHASSTGFEDGHFASKFLAPERSLEAAPERCLQVLRQAALKACLDLPGPLPTGWVPEPLGRDHVHELAALYGECFATYPFPINDPDYLLEIMEQGVFYYGIRHQERLVAVSSCETDPGHGLVEMTDFAARPDMRGKGAAFHLLRIMEQDMRHKGLSMAFSISRALSFPINISFSRLGYRYAGTLVHNTQIAGSLESMNVWYKDLRSS